MIWPAIERRIQPYLRPFWMDAYCIKNARRRFNAPPVKSSNTRNLFVDVSAISKHDAGTGIQRVTRAIGFKLSNKPPVGWTVRVVCADRKCPYHETRNKWAGDLHQMKEGGLTNALPGDVFLGLDYSLDAVYRYRKQLTKFKRNGGRLWFFVHDLLPIQEPQWFSDSTVIRYRKWLPVIASLADGFFCNSSHTLEALRSQLSEKYRLNSGYRSEVIPMGWELDIGRHSTGLPDGFDDLLQKLSQQPTALIVGTLEPRKGHADALAAFDRLWDEGCQYNLVVVGKPGWKTAELQALLRTHSQQGKHLFWLDNASDEALEKLYAVCNGVIVASLAEGYGLPLAEALGHGKPILARDIPIFRQHRNNSISYFPADADTLMLSQSIGKWVGSIRAKPKVEFQESLSSWRDAATAIWSALS